MTLKCAHEQFRRCAYQALEALLRINIVIPSEGLENLIIFVQLNEYIY